MFESMATEILSKRIAGRMEGRERFGGAAQREYN